MRTWQYSFLTLLLIVAGMFTSCQKKCSTATGMNVRFEGFDSTALEKVIITKYTKGDGFRQPVDSSIYYLSQSKNTIVQYDSVHHFVYWPYAGSAILTYSYDYAIRVSNAGDQYLITEMAITDERASCPFGRGSDNCACWNNVSSFRLNGDYVATGRVASSGSPSYYSVTIRK